MIVVLHDVLRARLSCTCLHSAVGWRALCALQACRVASRMCGMKFAVNGGRCGGCCPFGWGRARLRAA